jgi:hypothetical protein
MQPVPSVDASGELLAHCHHCYRHFLCQIYARQTTIADLCPISDTQKMSVRAFVRLIQLLTHKTFRKLH